MSNHSLKRRLRCYIVIPVFVALLIMSIAAYFSTRHEIEEVDDAQLARIAKLIYSLIPEHTQPETMATIESEQVFAHLGHRYQKYIAYRVWQGETLVFYSHNATSFGPRFTRTGYFDWKSDGEHWHTFVLQDKNNRQIEVAESYRVRNDITKKIMVSIFTPLALLLPLMLLIFSIGLKRGLLPLGEISNAVSKRTPADLTPIEETQSPHEVLPIIHSINQLMSRVRTAMLREREFTDHAAHELRTPLAVVKLHAQTALRSTDAHERTQVLTDLIHAVDRSTSVVEQLLSLARVEERALLTQPCDLALSTRECMKEFLPLALQKSISLELLVSEAANTTIFGSTDLVHTLISNLLTNAIKYSPTDSTIKIQIGNSPQQKTGVHLTIEDEGGGIADHELTMVMQRFYRIQGTQQPGAGLGLSIAQRICELLSAHLVLENRADRSGLRAKVTFTN